MIAKTVKGRKGVERSPVEQMERVSKIYSEQIENVTKQQKRIKILIVDDEPHIVKLIRLSLDPQKYEIYEAYSGLEALEIAKTVYPDLITLDIMMPNMSGYEVCKLLKKNPLTSYIPILMLSAKTELKDKMASIMTGADDYLTKPFDPDELENKIKVNLG
jgi:DNA-binding response OmpR family regulator